MSNLIRKRYSSDFKEQARALVALGKPVPEIAQELGIGISILYRWTQDVRATRTGPVPYPGQALSSNSLAPGPPPGRGRG